MKWIIHNLRNPRTTLKFYYVTHFALCTVNNLCSILSVPYTYNSWRAEHLFIFISLTTQRAAKMLDKYLLILWFAEYSIMEEYLKIIENCNCKNNIPSKLYFFNVLIPTLWVKCMFCLKCPCVSTCSLIHSFIAKIHCCAKGHRIRFPHSKKLTPEGEDSCKQSQISFCGALLQRFWC